MSAVLFTRSTNIAMSLGFAGTLVTLILSFYLLSVFDPEKGGIQLAEQSNFLDFAYYSVGVDGLNILFIPLTAILALLVLVYKAITRRTFDWKFIACLLGYEAILIGAFSALNAHPVLVLELTGVAAGNFIDALWRDRAEKAVGDHSSGAVLGLGTADDLGRFSFTWLRINGFRP